MRPVHAGQGVWSEFGNSRQRILQGNRLGRAARPRAPGVARFRYLAALAAAALSCSAAHAGAWPQAKGEGLVISSILYDRAEGYFDDDGTRFDGGYYEKREYATYTEYGLTDRITLVGRIAWQDVALVEAGIPDTAQGFAASELAARLLVWQDGPVVASVQLSGILPGGGENIADRPLGDGGLGAEVRLLAGFSPWPEFFFEAQPAYRWRDEDFLDEARLDLTAGWRPRDDMLLIVQGFSTWSVSDPVIGQRHFSQHKIQASAGFMTRFGEIHFGAYFTPAGRNAIDERAVFAALWQRF